MTFGVRQSPAAIKVRMKRETQPQTVEAGDAAGWESWGLVFSFVALWVWFLARQSALRAGQQLGVGWRVFLLAVLALMILITVRRLRRIGRALHQD